ncbi:MAG: type II secretion system protein, partial [Sedimentisphaerales bacterium]
MKRRAFTFIEVIMVVVILGILAAVVLPTFQGQTAIARESSAKDSLSTMRTQIEFYKMEHDGVPPGYVNGGTAPTVLLQMQFT